ncbi:MAG: hypothetical protein IJJ28_00210 [Lentisphaeria bacterium]|nr:hypothetical protein [Lentisphaeria bacterium]
MKFRNRRDIFECRRAGVASETSRGIIVAESPRLVMIERLRDGWFPDGYAIYRKADITEWRFHDSPDDPERLIQRRAGLTGHAPNVIPDLTDFPAAVADFYRSGTLFSLEKERSAPGVLYLLKVLALSPRSFLAAELDADGRWIGPARFYFDAITAIGVGGGYIDFYARLFGSAAPAAVSK